MHYTFLMILAGASMLLFSCNNTQPEANRIPPSSAESITKTAIKTNIPNDKDTMVVDRIAAVFYLPDSIQIAKAIAEDGEDNFYTGEDDAMYYLAGASKYLDSVKLEIINAGSCNYIKFVYTNCTFTLLKRYTLKDMNGIIFFDRVQKPFFPEYLDIEPDYKKYFKK